MASLTVFFLIVCIVVTCSSSPVPRSIEALQTTDVKEVQDIILQDIMNARNKRDTTYTYSYSASSKTESSVSWSMTRTETGNGPTINIGPGHHNTNYVKINYNI
ncbi:uncharacterized protein LOC112048959 [Bicyclus anynana]|uniref:Uncharacterized protein LOC112048959 n=1 Tax=Bicyclus anynana TaxID=110368 RepID=A0A6J1N6F2_BICAN|nr:uncharacterized protein LOC112048959 [Bicyclus anynana]